MRSVRFRFSGTWAGLSSADRDVLLGRQVRGEPAVRAAAEAIVADVRGRGDAALFDLARRFDGVELAALEVPRTEVDAAPDRIEAPLRRALERSAANIARVHGASRPVETSVTPEPGVTVVRRPDPVLRVGVYAPGGGAAYPSSVLMSVVPARVVGVREIVLASPPLANGRPAAVVLAAAAIAGVDRVFALGGAGAVAALAFGTESVPRVDRIVGPGNAWVSAAKLLVTSEVAIDCPAGPSEVVVIADETSDARAVAAELVAQAEHDPRAMAVALVVGAAAAARVRAELERTAISIPCGAKRGEVARMAMAALGGVLEVADTAEAVAAANLIAPEHLLLATASAPALVPEVRNAGSVFVGATASVAFGDYMTGANHVLPTGGLARSYSGLSPLDFVRWTTFQYVDRAAAGRLASDTALLADAEGLPGHAAAARLWSST